MNEFTVKNEQAFLDACGAIGVEPGWKLKSCITLTQRGERPRRSPTASIE
jgi:hypothetical protein